MRYAVYITRAQHWSFEARQRRPISDAEWRAYAESDPELRPLPALPCFDSDTGNVLRAIPVAATWEWTAHPRGVDAARPMTFEYDRGGIIVRSPDPQLLRKTVSVARALGARAIGDDGHVIEAVEE